MILRAVILVSKVRHRSLSRVCKDWTGRAAPRLRRRYAAKFEVVLGVRAFIHAYSTVRLVHSGWAASLVLGHEHRTYTRASLRDIIRSMIEVCARLPRVGLSVEQRHAWTWSVCFLVAPVVLSLPLPLPLRLPVNHASLRTMRCSPPYP